eukprot:TRINITY_DN11839_c0_g1_i2.p5 TRINITY_DN11839_c0_g1~~TRINITY_DN11839_c0_g1_i2.p5  ORF type:complete len:136 (-),score=20.06 TRINITY_DN11839_c0_g1_i2:1516-1923(-)
MFCCFFFLMIRRPPRSTHCISSAASDVYKRQMLYFLIVLNCFAEYPPGYIILFQQPLKVRTEIFLIPLDLRYLTSSFISLIIGGQETIFTITEKPLDNKNLYFSIKFLYLGSFIFLSSGCNEALIIIILSGETYS